MNKAFLYSIDALLSAIILIGGLVLIGSISQHNADTVQISVTGEDILTSLANVRIFDVPDLWVQKNINNGTIIDGNLSVMEQIGHFWALGDNNSAQYLAQLMLDQQYPGLGVRLTIDGDEILSRNSSKTGRDVFVSSKMISGIAQGESITGSSAVAYLRRIKDKRTSTFTVFGGFVGQGNISQKMALFPDDTNFTDIDLEMAPGAPFTIHFNGVQCGGVYTAPYYNGTPFDWELDACIGDLVPGPARNTVEIRFSQELNQSYVSGGLLEVRYKTSTLATNETVQGEMQYRFPGIDGVVNLFDGFSVPGTLQNLTVYLHYNVSNSTYLDIGDKRVWEDDANNTEKFVVLNDSYLKDPLGGALDYDQLSNVTIPIRLAGFAHNISSTNGSNADIVLITDFSGSMKKAVVDWDQGNLGSDCANAYTDDDVRRTLLATCVDNVLVDTVMNFSGNRIWPVFLHDDEAKWYNNPSNEAAISGYINSYANGKDKTCYACAFNRAYEIFDTFGDPSRPKFIVFMTDGVPTHCADGSCTSTSVDYGTQQCEGLCDTQGACDAADIPAQCTACIANNGGQSNAYFAANRSVNDFDAQIFTVGFGPVTDCSMAGDTLQALADMGNGTYQHSDQSDELLLIYENISQEILTRTGLSSQVLTTIGPQTRSELYDDSHINATFVLASQYLATQNEMTLQLQTAEGCSPTVPFFTDQRLIEAKAISYSSIHWTDYVAVGGVQTYNLTTFLLPYEELGDPTEIHTPIELYGSGTNIVTIETGDSPTNRTGCLSNNSVIYTIGINLSTERSAVVPDAEGCVWEVEFEDGTFENKTIPTSYTGPNRCSYQSANISYDPTDAYQLGTYEILSRLDFTKSGVLFVNLDDEDVEVIVTTISQVPYMWGPAKVQLEVTR